MAVDHKKFRTCDKTSFCRRHRDGHLSSLYNYRLDIDSVQFHLPRSKLEGDDGLEEDSKNTNSGIWKSLSDRILGTGESGNGNMKDPYVLGPAPTLTGLLLNNSPETSSGSKEQLEWSVHAMADGVVRMRVTEVYQTPGAAYEEARVTYDELVLSTDALTSAKHAKWIHPGDPYLVQVVGKEFSEKYTGLQYGDVEGKPGMFLLVRL